MDCVQRTYRSHFVAGLALPFLWEGFWILVLPCKFHDPEVWINVVSQKMMIRSSFCETWHGKTFVQDMHVARKHQTKQEVTDDKILAVVSTAEEATAAPVHNLYPSLVS